jgi:hypothetical protein
MNPFIDPESSREHFPELSHGLEEIASPSDKQGLNWSIDTLAHMAQVNRKLGKQSFNDGAYSVAP